MSRSRVSLTKDEKEKILAGESLSFPAPFPVQKSDVLTMALCEKQEWMCFWCGEKMSDVKDSPRFRTKDHIVPLSTGKHRARKATNIRAVCFECNQLRGQFTSMADYARHMKQVEEQLRQSQTALLRHKVTMSGRCYYCKIRFHVREWFHKLRAK